MTIPGRIKTIGFLVTLLFCADALAVVKMGVFPRRSPEATEAAFKPLAQKLSKELGEEVQLIVPKTFKEFWKAVKKNQFDLVHYNQYHYIRSHREQGYRVIVANEEFGKKQLSGVIAVRKDSGINSVKDLRGKMIVFGGGKKAMGSYIAPTAILKKAGLEEGRDYLVNFASTPPAAVIGMMADSGAASGTGNAAIEIVEAQGKVDASKLKTIATSEPFTHLPWAVNTNVSEAKAKKIQDIMTHLGKTEEGKKILASAKVTGFYAVSDKDYKNAREIINFATGERF